MKRVFAIDVLVCDTCGGATRIIAVLPDGDASRAILLHLGLPTGRLLRDSRIAEQFRRSTTARTG